MTAVNLKHQQQWRLRRMRLRRPLPPQLMRSRNQNPWQVSPSRHLRQTSLEIWLIPLILLKKGNFALL